jgi:D-serine deaminase-like pyridoxal phosphate-dependent protein
VPLSDLAEAIAGEPLPLALVDLDALDANVAAVKQLAGAKPVRVASKSVRSVELLKKIGATSLMTYSAAETAHLAAAGFTDLLLAYPTVHPKDVALLMKAGARATVDSIEQLAAYAGTKIPLVIDVDMSYRALGAHLGVRRSPIHSVQVALALRDEIDRRGLVFGGLLAYEAQIAGLTDRGAFSSWMNPGKRALKHLSRPKVETLRRTLAAALRPPLFNGGGSGSIRWAAAEEALTEITVGSAYLGGHLFDAYRDLPAPSPAAFFALQVVRRPGDGFVTCHGGGYVASGEPGPDRLPRPVWPAGLSLLQMEGAGEVQTPLRVEGSTPPKVGDVVLFRHAKSGELAEHFNEYLLVRGGKIVGRAPTYRGEGKSFLG